MLVAPRGVVHLRKQADVHESNAIGERWLPVPEYEGIYEVSDAGRIRSVDRHVTYRSGLVVFYRGRVLRQTVHRDGHLVVTLWRGNKGRTRRVHQLVMAAFVGPCPAGREVCHGDGNPARNCLSNLRYDTRSNNHRDAGRHGTHRNSRKAACPRGHQLIHPNLVPSQAKQGRRSCRACGRANARTIKARKASRPIPDFQTLSDICYAEIMT